MLKKQKSKAKSPPFACFYSFPPPLFHAILSPIIIINGYSKYFYSLTAGLLAVDDVVVGQFYFERVIFK